MVTYEALKSRVEEIAFVKPKANSEDIRSYLYLAGEAHKLLAKLNQVRTMDLPEEIELPFIEKEVKDIEEKLARIS